MGGIRNPAAGMEQALKLLGGTGRETDVGVREAAWVARCVGRGRSALLADPDLRALATTLQPSRLPRGTVLFSAGQPAAGVWIVREGQIELSVGSGRRRIVVQVLHPGDVDGDIPLLLEMPMPYTARASSGARCLFLSRGDFEALLAARPPIARRWLSSIAQRLATSQSRIIGLLGHSLTEQVSRLLLDEAVDGQVLLPQRTLAAMLGVQRPSLNKILKDLERSELISIGYSTIHITDPQELNNRAAG